MEKKFIRSSRLILDEGPSLPGCKGESTSIQHTPFIHPKRYKFPIIEGIMVTLSCGNSVFQRPLSLPQLIFWCQCWPGGCRVRARRSRPPQLSISLHPPLLLGSPRSRRWTDRLCKDHVILPNNYDLLFNKWYDKIELLTIWNDEVLDKKKMCKTTFLNS